MKKMTPLQLDALRELSMIGSGNTASGLSSLLGKRISLSVPKVQLLPFNEVADYLGGAEQTVSAIIFKLLGDIEGSIVLMFSQETAAQLLNLMLGRQQPLLRTFNEYEESALMELGNISTGTYLTSLSEVTKLKLTHSIPALAVDMLGAALDEVMISQAEEADQAVIIETEFSVGGEKVTGNILFVPNSAGMQKILSNLGVRTPLF